MKRLEEFDVERVLLADFCTADMPSSCFLVVDFFGDKEFVGPLWNVKSS
jgi:hypothetical protein